MDSALDIIKLIETICVSLAVISGGVAIIVKVIKLINDSHDRREKYDGYEKKIENLDKKIDDVEESLTKKITDAHSFAEGELKAIQDSMDEKLEDLQTTMDAKLQQISSELCMLSYCTLANLDGLKQLNCNGKVTEAREKMEKHLNQQAHGELK